MQGDTFLRNLTYREKNTATPINLTGAVVRGSIKKKVTDVTPVDSFTCALIDAINGKFAIWLAPSQTGAMDVGIYLYDVDITFPDTTVQTVVGGNFVVTAQVV